MISLAPLSPSSTVQYLKYKKRVELEGLLAILRETKQHLDYFADIINFCKAISGLLRLGLHTASGPLSLYTGLNYANPLLLRK
jgi:hypothetical protein